MKMLSFFMENAVAILIFAFIVVAFLGIEMVSAMAVMGLLETGALAAFWYTRVPQSVKVFLTTYPMMFLLDAGLFWLGWKILPDSSMMKGSFIMMHLMITFGMYWEHRRLRGKLRLQGAMRGERWNS